MQTTIDRFSFSKSHLFKMPAPTTNCFYSTECFSGVICEYYFALTKKLCEGLWRIIQITNVGSLSMREKVSADSQSLCFFRSRRDTVENFFRNFPQDVLFQFGQFNGVPSTDVSHKNFAVRFRLFTGIVRPVRQSELNFFFGVLYKGLF